MNIWRVGHILLMLPRACIVHAARHPLDAALSCYAQPFAYSAVPWAWDLDTIADQVRQVARRLRLAPEPRARVQTRMRGSSAARLSRGRAAWARAGPPPQVENVWALAEHWEAAAPGRIHTVLYEDLVAHPEAAVRELLAACGLAYEPAVLKFHERAPGRGVHTASQAQVRQPLYASAVRRWEAYAGRIAPLRARLAPLVERYERRLAAAAALRAERHSEGADGVEGSAAAAGGRSGGKVGDGADAAAAREQGGSGSQKDEL
jgi:hypothetical protein